jgi:hypothetical protein
MIALGSGRAVAEPGLRVPSPGGATPHEFRALFIGNSYTRSNDLPRVVERLARSVPGGPTLSAQRVANPGWDLTRHLRSATTLREVEVGGYSHVVLQGHSLSALEHPAELETSARGFRDAIQLTGARTVLFETWARRPGSALYRRELEGGPIAMQARITDCYERLSSELGVGVAPAGRAFLLAQQRLGPELPLFRSDGHHPSATGTYLAAAVLYTAITGHDARAATYRPPSVSPARARALLEVAWSSVNELVRRAPSSAATRGD